jgi:hypothetical protein
LSALRSARAAQEFFDLASQWIGLLTSGGDGLRRGGLRPWLLSLLRGGPLLLRGRLFVKVVQFLDHPEKTKDEKDRDLD